MSQIARSILAIVVATVSFWLVCLLFIAVLSGHFLLDEDAHPINGAGQFAVVAIFGLAALVAGYVVALLSRRGRLFHSLGFAALVFVDAILTDCYTSKYSFTLAQSLLLSALAICGGLLSVWTLSSRSNVSP